MYWGEAIGIASRRIVLVFTMAGQAPEIDIARIHRGEDVAEWIQGAEDGIIGQDDFVIAFTGNAFCRTTNGFADPGSTRALNSLVPPDQEALTFTINDVRIVLSL